MGTSEREIAHNTQEKFEFYLISLVFTLLALSIQTAKLGAFIFSDVMELIGWFSLLISGVAGLWRLEYVPVERIKQVQKNEFEDRIYSLQELQLKGEEEIYVLEAGGKQGIQEHIKNFQKAIEILDPVIEDIERRNLKKYTTHRYLFVVGIGALIISRAYGPAVGIVKGLIAP